MKTKLSLIAIMACIALSSSAKVLLPNLLCDNAVLQRNTAITLWGTAKPNSKVEITTSWNNKMYQTKASSDGEWSTAVSSTDAGGPYTLTFDDGEGVVKIKNVMLGEVWITSGQSNMELTMLGNPTQPIEGAIDAVLKAKRTTPIRLFKVEKNATTSPQSDVNGRWSENTAESVLSFSAASYFFASYLNEVLDIPIGIINASWGGSKIEAWLSKETLLKHKSYDLAHLDKPHFEGSPLHTPALMYNGMLAPLKNYKFKGLLWYQGEANRNNSEEYKKLFPLFVNSLRDYFDCGNFPVFYAQIAPYDNFGKGTNVVLMREAMAELTHLVDNCGMVTLTDIGEKLSIHPRYKREVGERFAYWALGHCYGYDFIEYRAPEYKAMKIFKDKRRGTCVALSFDYAPQGVSFKGENSRCFEIAGEDRVFYPAETRLQKNKAYCLELWSDKVPNPIAVRYAFHGYAKGDMFNNFGIPVSSFRTDSWEIDNENL